MSLGHFDRFVWSPKLVFVGRADRGDVSECETELIELDSKRGRPASLPAPT
jgi:hypothetical protein